ncbi:hypothetical protein CDL12_28042 [Handroanthus impetiginosus]|uniref:Uncharacterized protein n=1 Tax=Handroanthus impetiginosus TaxID=429701 RepID=A0A2G9G2C5_9LAMI|nr:hypothetical protein CDL12_28042 [Handroanthus impetiginosus]
MMLEFIAFVRLRIIAPNVPRPYKIPVGTVGAVLMCVPPTVLICVVLAFSSVKVLIVSLVALSFGIILQPCIKYSEKKRWFKFSTSSDLPDIHSARFQNGTLFAS